jgi:pyruvate/2-oxoglutarate dehydrogenase complex dihydrolipoamide acyltransferase (E2) component
MNTQPADMHVPRFGQGLDEALLVEWVAEVGTWVDRGDVVAVVETAKTTTEVVAERAGRVATRAVAAGTILTSGQVLYQLSAD